MPELFFEDLHVGQGFSSPPVRVTPEMWRDFLQSLGLDGVPSEDGAAVWINHAFSSAVTMKLLVGSDFKPSGGTIGLGVENLTWPRPVRIDDRLSAESVIVALRDRTERRRYGLVLLNTKVHDSDGTIVQEMTSPILVPYRDRR